MARTLTADPDFDPKHRIVGAVVLVAIAFIAFSLILDDRPTTKAAVERPAGSSPNTKIIVTKMPVAAGKPAPTSEGEAKTVTPSEIPATDAVKTPAIKPAPSTTTAKAQTKQAATTTSARPKLKSVATVKKGWMVQVGTFSNPANARHLSKQLKAQDYTVVLKVIALNKGRAVRVRVGPFVDKAAATVAQARIAGKTGVKGVVLAQQ